MKTTCCPRKALEENSKPKNPKKRLKTPSADGREWADKGSLGIVRLNQPSK